MKTLASLKTVSLLASLVYFPSPTMRDKADRTKKARECFFWSWRKQISLELIEQKANWKWINQGVIIVKALVFLVTYGFNSWTIMKAKCQRRTDALELWCWRRLLRVPQTARRPNQSILKEITPEYLLEGLLLQLKLQNCGHLMQRADSRKRLWCWERLKAKRRRGQQGIRWSDRITNSVEMNLSKLRKIVEHRGAWCATAHKVAKRQTQLSYWTTTRKVKYI